MSYKINPKLYEIDLVKELAKGLKLPAAVEYHLFRVLDRGRKAEMALEALRMTLGSD